MEKIVHTINYTGMSCGHEWLPQRLKSMFYEFFYALQRLQSNIVTKKK